LEPKYRNGKTTKHPNGHPWSSPNIPPRTIDDFNPRPFPKYVRVKTQDLFEELAGWWKDLRDDGPVPECFQGLKTVPWDEWNSGKSKATEVENELPHLWGPNKLIRERKKYG